MSALPAVNGASSTSYEKVKDRPILVTFFASWCPPCLKEFTHLNKLYLNYRHTDLRIITINVYEKWDENDEQRMKKLIYITNPLFPTLVGSENIRELFGGIDCNGTHLHRSIHKKGAKKMNAPYEELVRAVDK